ncbi:hypothetical protein BMAFMH_E0362, partial [Burkholderia mallei FMH]
RSAADRAGSASPRAATRRARRRLRRPAHPSPQPACAPGPACAAVPTHRPRAARRVATPSARCPHSAQATR